jgi:2-octaprenyl-6-methoxyphenol hydroxylase
VTFHAGEIGEDQFGLNMPNSVLVSALAKAVAAHDGIKWHKSLVRDWQLGVDRAHALLENGIEISASLAVAADGRLSPAREAAGIHVARHDYPQSALVLNFGHSREHGFISTEFHTETGPFTQVPLPGNRSSLVWVVAPDKAEELMALDEASLSRTVEDKMRSMLGRVTVEQGRQLYPLSAATPMRFAANRVALVGEAAHLLPPIGAQGLNLGIRDSSDLVEIASKNKDDPGSVKVLAAYDFKRRPDIMARSGAVNALNRTLLSDMLPAQLLRSGGLAMLGAIPPLRAFFMREGLKPGSGFAALAGGWGAHSRR